MSTAGSGRSLLRMRLDMRFPEWGSIPLAQCSTQLTARLLLAAEPRRPKKCQRSRVGIAQAASRQRGTNAELPIHKGQRNAVQSAQEMFAKRATLENSIECTRSLPQQPSQPKMGLRRRRES